MSTFRIATIVMHNASVLVNLPTDTARNGLVMLRNTSQTSLLHYGIAALRTLLQISVDE